MITFKILKIREDGVVKVHVKSSTPIWPRDNEIQVHAATFLKWDAARIIDVSPVDGDGTERVYRFVRFYAWTVKVLVADTWVADGFDLTADRAHSIVQHELRYARGDEIECEIVSAPSDADMAAEQGYDTTAKYLASRDV